MKQNTTILATVLIIAGVVATSIGVTVGVWYANEQGMIEFYPPGETPGANYLNQTAANDLIEDTWLLTTPRGGTAAVSLVHPELTYYTYETYLRKTYGLGVGRFVDYINEGMEDLGISEVFGEGDILVLENANVLEAGEGRILDGVVFFYPEGSDELFAGDASYFNITAALETGLYEEIIRI